MTVPFLPYEIDILMWINRHHTPVLDVLMYSISNVIVWLPLVAVLLWYLFARKPWQEGAILLFCIALCLVTTHLLGNVWAKNFFERPRPTFTEGVMEHLHLVYNYTGRSFSFFSGHATNFFAAATFLALAIGRRAHSLALYIIVSLVAYSRMYQGVHFLSDILVGVAVGACVAYAYSTMYQWLRRHFLPSGNLASHQIFASGYALWLGSVVAFIPVLLVYSWQVASIIARLQE